MSEFFKGWRRKAGCVALVLALVLSAGWVMSYLSLIEIRLHDAILESNSGTVTFVLNLPAPDYASRLLRWSVDYWIAVTPLILLSAVMLLWPQRKLSGRVDQYRDDRRPTVH